MRSRQFPIAHTIRRNLLWGNANASDDDLADACRCFAALLNVEWRWLLGSRRSDHGNLLLGDINRIGVGLTFGIGLATTLMKMVVYLGVALFLSPQINRETNAVEAHAWTSAGRIHVTGGADCARFKVVSAYVTPQLLRIPQ